MLEDFGPCRATERCDLQRLRGRNGFGIRVRDERVSGRKAGGRLRQDRQQMAICRRSETGATGLEPATSGVTGLFHRYDDWRRLTRDRSIHAGLRAFGTDLRTIA